MCEKSVVVASVAHSGGDEYVLDAVEEVERMFDDFDYGFEFISREADDCPV